MSAEFSTREEVLRILSEHSDLDDRAAHVASLYRDGDEIESHRVEYSPHQQVTVYWNVPCGYSSTEKEWETFPLSDLWASDEEIIQKIESDREAWCIRQAEEAAADALQREDAELRELRALAKRLGYEVSKL